jgi:hypothetical protein
VVGCGLGDEEGARSVGDEATCRCEDGGPSLPGRDPPPVGGSMRRRSATSTESCMVRRMKRQTREAGMETISEGLCDSI